MSLAITWPVLASSLIWFGGLEQILSSQDNRQVTWHNTSMSCAKHLILKLMTGIRCFDFIKCSSQTKNQSFFLQLDPKGESPVKFWGIDKPQRDRHCSSIAPWWSAGGNLCLHFQTDKTPAACNQTSHFLVALFVALLCLEKSRCIHTRTTHSSS